MQIVINDSMQGCKTMLKHYAEILKIECMSRFQDRDDGVLDCDCTFCLNGDCAIGNRDFAIPANWEVEKIGCVTYGYELYV